MWNLYSCNSVYSQFLAKKEQERRKLSLRRVKAQVDNKKPARFTQQSISTCRGGIKQDRYDQIEKENHILLNKMLNIDKKPSNLNPRVCAPKTRNISSNTKKKRAQSISRISKENQVTPT